jgi:hypothetical protein
MLVDPAARARVLGLAALLSLTPLAPAWGEDIPECRAAIAGELSVQADVQCECRFFPASLLAGTRAGYRWDCGVLRPRLNYAVPVDLNPYPYPLPEGLSLDQSSIPSGDPMRPQRP